MSYPQFVSMLLEDRAKKDVALFDLFRKTVRNVLLKEVERIAPGVGALLLSIEENTYCQLDQLSHCDIFVLNTECDFTTPEEKNSKD